MSEENLENNLEDAPANNSMAAFSPLMKELEDALDMLYIKSNASGRNKFRDKWPFVAQYLFGEVLIDYDNHGPKDREHRAELEERADERRILLKVTISQVVEKSVDAGMLQFDYVGKVIDTFGADLSKFLYAEDVIERVRPGLLAQSKESNKPNDEKNKKESDAASPVEQPTPTGDPEDHIHLRVQEKEILKNYTTPNDDDMDDIKPIDTTIIKEEAEAAEESKTEDQNSTKEKTSADSSDDFSIPKTLETPQEQPNDAPTTNAQEQKNEEPASAPIIAPMNKAQDADNDPEMHIPETLIESEDAAKTAQPATQEETPPQKPHAPKVEKGFYASMFNTIAEKKAA